MKIVQLLSSFSNRLNESSGKIHYAQENLHFYFYPTENLRVEVAGGTSNGINVSFVIVKPRLNTFGFEEIKNSYFIADIEKIEPILETLCHAYRKYKFTNLREKKFYSANYESIIALCEENLKSLNYDNKSNKVI